MISTLVNEVMEISHKYNLLDHVFYMAWEQCVTDSSYLKLGMIVDIFLCEIGKLTEKGDLW